MRRHSQGELLLFYEPKKRRFAGGSLTAVLGIVAGSAGPMVAQAAAAPLIRFEHTDGGVAGGAAAKKGG